VSQLRAQVKGQSGGHKQEGVDCFFNRDLMLFGNKRHHVIHSHNYWNAGVKWGRNTFPHFFAVYYIETWLRSHRCASDTQIRTASQKSTVKQEDPVWKYL